MHINGDLGHQPSISASMHPRPAVLSSNQKYKTAFVEAQKLASLASDVSMAKYQDRMKVLRDLVKLWEEDEDAAVINIAQEVSYKNVVLDDKTSYVCYPFNVQSLDSVNYQKFQHWSIYVYTCGQSQGITNILIIPLQMEFEVPQGNTVNETVAMEDRQPAVQSNSQEQVIFKLWLWCHVFSESI